jgi:hypothetical protein
MKAVKFTLIAVAVLAVAGLAGAADSHKVLEQNQPPVVRQVDFGPAVWLGQAPNASNGIFSDAGCDICGGAQVLADNVVVSTGGVGINVNQIVIWGGYYPGNTPTSANFEIIFHYDSGGLPGGVLGQTSVLPSADVLTGVTLFGVSEHQLTFDFPPVTLPDGTYFIEMYTNTGGGTDDWFWETGNVDATHGIAGQAYAFTAPGSSWSYDASQDMSITLNGELVPVELQSFDVE